MKLVSGLKVYNDISLVLTKQYTYEVLSNADDKEFVNAQSRQFTSIKTGLLRELIYK